MCNKPPLYRKTSYSCGIETAEVADGESEPTSKALNNRVQRWATAPQAPEIGSGDGWYPQGHRPTAVLTPSSEPSMLQSILLNDDTNDGAASDGESATISLTASTAVGSSSSSSCEDVPSGNLFESYQECVTSISLSQTARGCVQELPRKIPKEEWL